MARLLLTVFILIGVLAVVTGRSGPWQPRNCKRIEKRWNKCKAQGKGSFGLCRSTDKKCKRIEKKMVKHCGHECEPEPQIFTMAPTRTATWTPKGTYIYSAAPCTNGESQEYRGDVAMTLGGETCQKWTSQTPEQHDRTPENFPDAGLGDHNKCRDPDNEGTPWCYSTGASRWGKCFDC